MNPFADYAQKALSTQPPALLGPIKLRADARARYSEIVDALNSCETRDDVEDYIFSIEKELIQFLTELDYYWEGDGDFAGLAKEIERARVRVDEGLDYPRYEN